MSITEEQFKAKQTKMETGELLTLAKEELSKLCASGGKSFRMCVPPMVNDTDMLFSEAFRRLEQYEKSEVANRNASITLGLPVRIEKTVTSWRKGDQHDCPGCGALLSEPYKCQPCNMELKLRMVF